MGGPWLSLTVSTVTCLTMLVIIVHSPIVDYGMLMIGAPHRRFAPLQDPPGANYIAQMIQSLGELLLDLKTLENNINETTHYVAINDIYDWKINQHPNFTSDEYEFKLRCEDGNKIPRHVYVLRHTETVTAISRWYELAFDEQGNYVIDDLNLPPMLPYREGFPETFIRDVPLTVNGHMHSWLMGHGFKERGLVVSHVYAAPCMKAIETANTFLTGMGLMLPINIEPGILGWLNDYVNMTFLTEKELYWYNISINANYEPVLGLDELDFGEDRMAEYPRTAKVARQILQTSKEKAPGSILIISDLSTTETITRRMLREDSLDKKTFQKLYTWKPELPPGIMAVLEENCAEPEWHRVRPPIPPYTSRHVRSYNWTFMLI